MVQVKFTPKLTKLIAALLLVILSAGFNNTVKAQTGIPVDPSLQAVEDSIKGFMNYYGNVPGITVAIAKNNQLVFLRSYGYSDSAHVVPMQPDNMGRIMSISKPITWSAIMKCVDLGLIPNTDALVFDPTNGILGQEPYVLGQYTDARINTVTVQNLLDMVAGWDGGVQYLPSADYPPYYGYNGGGGDPINWPLSVPYYLGVPNPVTKENYITFLLRHGLDHDPGTYYSYSNTGYTMLGRVVEKLSGMTYEHFVQTYLAAPTGICDMHVAHTYANEAYEREMYYNDPYMDQNSNGDGTWVPKQYGGRQISDMDAHGGWVLTARDLLRYFAGLQTQLSPSSYATVPTSWSGAIEGTNACWANNGTVQYAAIVNKRLDALSAQEGNDELGNMPSYCMNVVAFDASLPTYDLSQVPTVPASGITFSSVQSNNFTLNWTNGNGTNRMVIASADTVVNAFPLDGNDYTANAAFGTSGTSLGNNNYVVYNGTGTGVTVTNLTAGVKYYFRVVEYNKNTTTGNYSLYTLCDCGTGDMIYGIKMAGGSDTAICAGSAMAVNYVANGVTFNSGNTFTAQLSDANGNFGSPVNIGSSTTTSASGAITVTIPGNTPAGLGYVIRINSSNPASTGAAGDTGIHISALFTWYRDADGDGFGNPSLSVQSCTQPVGYVLNNLDCNDANAAINPYAVEVCGNGIDDNCDGYTDQEINKALNFDGVNDRVQALNTVMPANTTIEAWINTTSTNLMSIVEFEMTDNAGIYLTGGQLEYIQGNFGGSSQGWYNGPNIADGNWHHIAVTIGSTQITAYVDGNSVFQVGNSLTIFANVLNIGNNVELSLPFQGSIDEVRIWKTVLTQSQIKASMNMHLDGNEANLYRYYDFDEGIPGADNNGIVSLRDRTVDSSNNATLQYFALTGSTSNWVSSWTYPALYADNDGDGFGSGTAWKCGSMYGLVNNNLDCNDNDAAINPYAVEVCGNGIDDDCDGYTDVMINKALNFDGVDDCVSVPVWPHNPPFTLEAWIKTSSGSSTMNIMDWEGTNYAQLYIQNGYPGYAENFSGWAGGWNVADGNWHHLALVRTTNSVTMYIDGSQAWTNSISNTLSTSIFSLGGWSNGGLNFSGSMDEVRVWKTALTQGQIQATMNHKLDGNEANLVRYYNFDEGKPGLDNVGISSLRDRMIDSTNNATLENFALTGSTSNWVSSWTYPTLYADNDGDGFGAGTAWTCGTMTGWVTNNLDCNDNDASISPRAQELVDGIDNNCNGAIDENAGLNFNGSNNYAQLNWFERPVNMTTEFWIKTTETNSGQEDILSWIGYGSGVQNYTELALINGGLFYQEVNNGGGAGLGYYTVNDGNWHHVALSRSASLISLYVDGVLRLTNSFNVVTSTSTFNLGFIDWNADSTSPNPDRFFNGTIDELHVYSEVRSQSQIQADMVCADRGPATNLMCYYDFNQGVPNGTNTNWTNIYDYSGNMGSGSLHNFSLSGSSSNFVAGEPAPIIVVQGNSTTILNNENTPSTGNNTDFGSESLNTPLAETFTLKNTGTASLTVSAITSVGTNQTEFVVSGITLPAVIAASSSTTFTLTFTPTANGLRTSVIHVTNTTCQQGDYNFAVQGEGGAIVQWTGAGGNSSWSNAANWSTNSVPNSCSTNVLISSTSGSWPTISSAVNVGDFTMTAGTLGLSGNLSICGDVTGATSGNAPQVTGTGTLILSGSSQQTISGKLQANNVRLDNSTGAVMQTGSSLDVLTQLDLQAGNLNASAGTLTLRSTSVTQAAIINDFSFGSPHGTYTGNVIAQRYYGAPTASNDFSQHMLGLPVGGNHLSALGSSNSTSAYYEAATGGPHNCSELNGQSGTPYGNVFSFVEAHASSCVQDGWLVEASSTPDSAGKGYSVVLGNGSGTLSLTGPPNLATSYSPATTNSNYAQTTSDQNRPYTSGINLLSNPYPASLNVAALVADNTGNFSPVVYSWSESEGMYYLPDTLAPFQAFKVIQTSDGNGNYVINGTSRTLNSGTFQRVANPIELNMTVTNTGTGLTDQTTVGFNPNSTAVFNAAYDLIKLPGALTRHTLYTLNSGYWLWVNVQRSINETSTVPVGFEPGASGTYTANFSGLNSFDATSYITLEDTKLNIFQNVRNGDYTFTANATDKFNRFILHFTPPATINTTDATCNSEGMINIIQQGTAKWNYIITDAGNTTISSGTLNVASPVNTSAAPGLYTLTLADANGYTVVKTIEVNGTLPVIASFNATATAQVNDDITFSSTAENATGNDWNFGDGATATGIIATHNYTAAGAYNVTLISTDGENCSSTVSHPINVISSSVTGIQSLGQNNIKIWSNENMVNVSFGKVSDGTTVSIYDVLGQQLVNDKLMGAGTLYTKQINDIEEGYVIVSVKNNEQVVTAKVYITNSK